MKPLEIVEEAIKTAVADLTEKLREDDNWSRERQVYENQAEERIEKNLAKILTCVDFS